MGLTKRGLIKLISNYLKSRGLVAGPLKGGRGCLMPPPCLESQGCHLIPPCYLFFCSSAESCYSLCLFSLSLLAYSPDFFFPEISPIFFVKRQAFLNGFWLAARRSKLVGSQCSMLPCGFSICCYVFI